MKNTIKIFLEGQTKEIYKFIKKEEETEKGLWRDNTYKTLLLYKTEEDAAGVDGLEETTAEELQNLTGRDFDVVKLNGVTIYTLNSCANSLRVWPLNEAEFWEGKFYNRCWCYFEGIRFIGCKYINGEITTAKPLKLNHTTKQIEKITVEDGEIYLQIDGVKYSTLRDDDIWEMIRAGELAEQIKTFNKNKKGEAELFLNEAEFLRGLLENMDKLKKYNTLYFNKWIRAVTQKETDEFGTREVFKNYRVTSSHSFNKFEFNLYSKGWHNYVNYSCDVYFNSSFMEDDEITAEKREILTDAINKKIEKLQENADKIKKLNYLKLKKEGEKLEKELQELNSKKWKYNAIIGQVESSLHEIK